MKTEYNEIEYYDMSYSNTYNTISLNNNDIYILNQDTLTNIYTTKNIKCKKNYLYDFYNIILPGPNNITAILYPGIYNISIIINIMINSLISYDYLNLYLNIKINDNLLYSILFNNSNNIVYYVSNNLTYSKTIYLNKKSKLTLYLSNNGSTNIVLNLITLLINKLNPSKFIKNKSNNNMGFANINIINEYLLQNSTLNLILDNTILNNIYINKSIKKNILIPGEIGTTCFLTKGLYKIIIPCNFEALSINISLYNIINNNYIFLNSLIINNDTAKNNYITLNSEINILHDINIKLILDFKTINNSLAPILIYGINILIIKLK